MTTKTTEKVTHQSTPKGLKKLLHVKWTEGRELLRNSRRFDGKEGWEPVSTVGTRVVFDTEWKEYGVYVYINEKRYYPADAYRQDKSEALELAKSLRLCSDFTVRAAPSKKVTKKAKPSSKKKPVAKKATSPKVTRIPNIVLKAPTKAKTSPKVKKASPKVKPEAKKAVARRARHQRGRTPTLTGLRFEITANNQVKFIS